MSTTFAPLPETSTADLVAERIRGAILDGSLRPGDRLIEDDLAHHFEVSRGPVREAIRLLAPEGLVILRRNRGAVIASPTFDDVLEVYAVRLSLGTLALETAVSHGAGRSPQCAQAALLLDALRDYTTRSDANAVLEADLAFQAAVLSLSNLTRISALLDQSAREAASFVRLLDIRYDATDHEALVERHERLLTAITDGDADAARAAWRAHIRCTVEEFARGHAGDDLGSIRQHPLATDILDDPTKETA